MLATAIERPYRPITLARIPQAVIIALLFGYAGWNREFARLTVFEPLYAAEIGLAIAVPAVVLAVFTEQKVFPPVRLMVLLGLLGAWGVLVTALTWHGQSALFVARDLTQIAYASFALLGAWALQSASAGRSALTAIVAGATFGTLTLWGRFLVDPTLLRYGHLGHSALGFFCLLSVFLLVRYPNLFPAGRWRLPLATVLSIQVIASGYRTLFVVAGVMFIVGLGGTSIRQAVREMRLIGAAFAGVVVLGASVLGVLVAVGGDYITDLASIALRFSRLFSDGLAGESSYQFRTEAWSGAWRLISESPILGEGPGRVVQLYFDPSCLSVGLDNLNCGNPHNTFLSLAIRFGLPATILVVGAVIHTAMNAFRRRAAQLHAEQVDQCWNLLVISLAVYGLTGLMLESPFLAIPFWIALGVSLNRSSVRSAVLRVPLQVEPPDSRSVATLG